MATTVGHRHRLPLVREGLQVVPVGFEVKEIPDIRRLLLPPSLDRVRIFQLTVRATLKRFGRAVASTGFLDSIFCNYSGVLFARTDPTADENSSVARSLRIVGAIFSCGLTTLLRQPLLIRHRHHHRHHNHPIKSLVDVDKRQ